MKPARLKFMKIRSATLTLTLSAIIAFPGLIFASKDTVRDTLVQVPAIEMPAKAAELVGAAKARNRGPVTVEVVKGGIALNPNAATSIVSAIAKSSPDMASVAAGAAAEAQPKQAVEIAKAAAAAVPAKAGKIVAAVCRAVPTAYKQVAAAVAKVSPGAGKEILQAVGSVFPELKASIETAMTSYGMNTPSVPTILDAVKNPNPSPAATLVGAPAVSGAGGGARGPTVGAPYVPYSTTPGNVTPSGSGIVGHGGRTYSSP